MPIRPHPSAALPLLRRELPTEPTEPNPPTAQQAWSAFLRFAHYRFAIPDTPDADGLLFQYGPDPAADPPAFTLDLTRQFAVTDPTGDHDHYTQIHCELHYKPSPALRILGTFTSWHFPDPDDTDPYPELASWAQQMCHHLTSVRTLRPAGFHLYEEQV
jgi:hypothetical protein